MKLRLSGLAAALALGIALVAPGLAAAQSILERVKQNGVVRIGTGNDTPPMNYLDDTGKWTGFSTLR